MIALALKGKQAEIGAFYHCRSELKPINSRDFCRVMLILPFPSENKSQMLVGGFVQCKESYSEKKYNVIKNGHGRLTQVMLHWQNICYSYNVYQIIDSLFGNAWMS